MTSGARTEGSIDWPAVQAEALDILVRYLRIPSVNPPGDEAPAARFLNGNALAPACRTIWILTFLDRASA